MTFAKLFDHKQKKMYRHNEHKKKKNKNGQVDNRSAVHLYRVFFRMNHIIEYLGHCIQTFYGRCIYLHISNYFTCKHIIVILVHNIFNIIFQ